MKPIIHNDIIIYISLFLLPPKDKCLIGNKHKTSVIFANKEIYYKLKKRYLNTYCKIMSFYNKKLCHFHNKNKCIIANEFIESYEKDKRNNNFKKYDYLHEDNTYFFHLSEENREKIKDFNDLLKEILLKTKFRIIGSCCSGNGIQYTDK